MEEKGLQNEERILPGGIGTINGREIIKSESDYKNGSVTLTIAGRLRPFLQHRTEDAEYEIVEVPLDPKIVALADYMQKLNKEVREEISLRVGLTKEQLKSKL